MYFVVVMAEVTIAIPEDVKHKMELLPEVDWSRKLEEAVAQELKRQLLLMLADKAFERSELREEDALLLGEKVKASVHNRFRNEHPEEYK